MDEEVPQTGSPGVQRRLKRRDRVLNRMLVYYCAKNWFPVVTFFIIIIFYNLFGFNGCSDLASELCPIYLQLPTTMVRKQCPSVFSAQSYLMT